MFCYKKITDDLFWVGGNNRRLSMFEGVYPVPEGVSYNSYLLMDEKTVLFDTVDQAVTKVFFENIAEVLGDRKLDYLVVHHMEPDHSSAIAQIILLHPEVKIVCNAKISAMMKQFFEFDTDFDERAVIVKEGDMLSSGRHNLTFLMAPMVHWPEVMVTYDTTDKILFSADAFGSFGALNGAIFADEVDFDRDFLDEARRYYTNIVGKYGTQVQALLKKASAVEINLLCPLHGFVWRKNIGYYIEKYMKWSTYTPENNGVMIAYASVYGNTENAAEILSSRLRDMGIRTAMYDVSVTHASEIIAAAFKWSHLVLASTTYNAGVFIKMDDLIHDLVSHNIQNRTVAMIENGSWAATSGNLIRAELEKCKNMTILDQKISLKSSLKKGQLAEIDALVQAIADTMPKTETISHTQKIETNSLFKISYGLFVLTARQGTKDNGCIINTVMQITNAPNRVAIAVNKANYTHDMILETKQFNISVLTIDAPFQLFKQFGFQSGKDTDKFAGEKAEKRTENNLRYLEQYSNAVISGKVIETCDYDTHTVFIADITEAMLISNVSSVTYQYYLDNIKPKPQPVDETKKGYVCKICGFVYEGDELPEGYICPICKHGVEDFERIG
jgi:Uncharacterized flavoproteins